MLGEAWDGTAHKAWLLLCSPHGYLDFQSLTVTIFLPSLK